MQKGPTAPKFSTKDGFTGIILLVIVVAVLVVGGAFYLGRQSNLPPDGTPTPSAPPSASQEPTGSLETANWKTYANSETDFTFKYPSGYKISETFTPETVSIAVTNFDMEELYPGQGIKPKKNPDDEDVFDMSIYKSLDLNTSLQKEKGQYKDTESNKYSFSDYSVGSEAGFKVFEDATFPDGTQSSTFSVVTVYDGKRFTFGLRNNQPQHIKVFDQILSTLQFTQ